MDFANVLSDVSEGELISLLEFAVVLPVLLDSIVCKMNEHVLNFALGDIKLLRGQTGVSFFEEVNAVVMVNQNPVSDVKLSFVNQQRSLDVLLNHKRLGLDESC